MIVVWVFWPIHLLGVGFGGCLRESLKDILTCVRRQTISTGECGVIQTTTSLMKMCSGSISSVAQIVFRGASF